MYRKGDGMRILLLNNEYPPIGGGGATVTAFLAREFVRLGHDVKLVTARFQDLLPHEQVDGYDVYRIRALRKHADSCSGPGLIAFAASAWAFSRRLLRTWRPDFVQAYFAVPSGVVAYALSLEFGIPYGAYMGGSDVPGANPGRWSRLYPLLTPMIKRVWRNASLNAIASRGLLDLARQAAPDVTFHHIPNGVDLERFHPVERSMSETVRISSVGRLIPRKGFQYVIRALPLVRAQATRPFRLEIVGSGEYRRELEELALRLGVEEHVHFRGAASYDELLSTYQTADIFTLMSESEGMACVMLEAMATGLPLVASRAPGNDELVRHGENGFLIDPNDTRQLADCLTQLVNDAALRGRMAQRSLELIRPYDWRQIALHYDQLYQSIYRPKFVSAMSLKSSGDTFR